MSKVFAFNRCGINGAFYFIFPQPHVKICLFVGFTQKFIIHAIIKIQTLLISTMEPPHFLLTLLTFTGHHVHMWRICSKQDSDQYSTFIYPHKQRISVPVVK